MDIIANPPELMNKRKVHSAFPGPLVEQIGFFQGYAPRIENFLEKGSRYGPTLEHGLRLQAFLKKKR
jgi:hypothetical protein